MGGCKDRREDQIQMSGSYRGSLLLYMNRSKRFPWPYRRCTAVNIYYQARETITSGLDWTRAWFAVEVGGRRENDKERERERKRR